MKPDHARHFVRASPPSAYAGVGAALREAFPMDGRSKSLRQLEELIASLD
jgi:hypothetical protein